MHDDLDEFDSDTGLPGQSVALELNHSTGAELEWDSS